MSFTQMGQRAGSNHDGPKPPRRWLRTMVGFILGALVSCGGAGSDPGGSGGSDSGGSAGSDPGGAGSDPGGSAGSPGSGASSGSDGGDGAIPEGCEFLAETNPTPECRSDDSQCEQAQTEDLERDYTLVVDGSEMTAEHAERVECVLGWLDALGLQARANLDGDIAVAAKYPDIEPVLRSAALTHYWVGCAHPRCEYCELLDEQQCAEDAFCVAYDGWRVDDAENQECLAWDAKSFASCKSAQDACGQAPSHARDSNGDCWYFTQVCFDQTLLPVDETCGGEEASVPFCE